MGVVMATRNYIRDGRAPIPENELTSKIMSSIRAKNTKPELILRKALFHSGLSGYRLHWEKIPGRPDIVYPGAKIAIFVHGCFWHRCPNCNPPFPKTHTEFWNKKFQKNIERDKQKKEDLEKLEWQVLIFWECQLRSDLQNCVAIVRLNKLKYY
jgi:DNA mismatch endonuclease, patch repair protein